MSDFAVITRDLGWVFASHANRIVQIGYDYIQAVNRMKKLEHDLDEELKRQGLFDRKQAVLREIANGFDLEWKEK